MDNGGEMSFRELKRLCGERGLLIVAFAGDAGAEPTGVVVKARSDNGKLRALPACPETSSSGSAYTVIRIAAGSG